VSLWRRKKPLRPYVCIRCLSGKGKERLAAWRLIPRCRCLYRGLPVCDEHQEVLSQEGCHICGAKPQFAPLVQPGPPEAR
jgi:hypothetical protein